VNLKNVKKADGTPLDPSHIYIAGFWSNGNTPFIIDKVFLSNDLTAIDNIPDNSSEDLLVDVYSTTGIRIRSQVKREIAIKGLSNGVYIIGGKKIMVLKN